MKAHQNKSSAREPHVPSHGKAYIRHLIVTPSAWSRMALNYEFMAETNQTLKHAGIVATISTMDECVDMITDGQVEEGALRYFVVSPSARLHMDITNDFMVEMDRMLESRDIVVTFIGVGDELDPDGSEEGTVKGLEEHHEQRIEADSEDVLVAQKQEPSLMGLPSEVRCQIWGLLLTNPELASPRSVSLATNHGRTARYDLHCEVLRACRLFHEEASGVLYSNTFYMACLPSSAPLSRIRSQITISPLTRYLENRRHTGHQTIRACPAAARVHKWKVIISRAILHPITAENRQPAHASFFEFCRAIHGVNLKHIELLVVPRGLERTNHRRYADLGSVLRPLILVDKLKQPLLIRDAIISEVCDSFNLRSNPEQARLRSAISDGFGPLEMVRYQGLLASRLHPREAAFKMNSLLLAYAQSFETYLPFADEMGFDYLQLPHLPSLSWTYHRYRDSPLGNPYRRREPFVFHPLEAALLCAKQTSDGEDIGTFKLHRQRVVSLLEGQYQRISVAASAMVEFVREEKRLGGMLDAAAFVRVGGYFYYRNANFDDSLDRAMVLVQNYTDSFLRDLPGVWDDWTLTYLRSLYATTALRTNCNKLREFYNDWNREAFVVHFKFTIDALEQQFFKIQTTRRELFQEDILNDRRCNIDIATYNIEERIDWTVNEPVFEPDNGFNEGFAGIDVGNGWVDPEDYDDDDCLSGVVGCEEGVLIEIEIEPEKLVVFDEEVVDGGDMWEGELDSKSFPRSMVGFSEEGLVCEGSGESEWDGDEVLDCAGEQAKAKEVGRVLRRCIPLLRSDLMVF